MNTLGSNVLPFERPATPSLYSLDIEAALLGRILIDERAFDDAFLIIPESNYFGDRNHATIYESMIRLAAFGQTIGPKTVAESLRRNGTFSAIGGQEMLQELISHGHDLMGLTLGGCCRSIAGYQCRRDALKASAEIAAISKDLAVPDEEIAGRVQSIASTIGVARAGGEGMTAQDLGARLFDRMISASPPGVPSGFYDLDAILGGGIQKGELAIVGARPSMGKTAFACTWALQAARFGYKGIFFSLETTKEDIAFRLVSAQCEIPYQTLKMSSVVPEDIMARATPAIMNLPVSLKIRDTSDDPGLSPADICSQVRIEKRKNGLDFIVIDYLTLLDFHEKNGGDRTNAIARGTRLLKLIAGECNIAVICLAQLSRGVESRPNKRPIQSDLRDSGAVEQDADVILFPYRDDYYNPDTADRGLVEIGISKNRNGPTGVVKLLSELQFSRFGNLASSNK